MINVILDKEVTFDLPEGVYSALVTGIKQFTKQAGRGSQDWVRILFEVDVPGMRDLECKAGRNFLLSFKSGSDLRNFLTPALEPNFFKDNSAKSIDLEELVVGLKGKVQLRHFTGAEYEKPMVVVDGFQLVEGKDLIGFPRPAIKLKWLALGISLFIMKTISYNSAVAELCGNNGIIKAVLINYIYNYHKPNRSKGAGSPACITLAEFIYQYTHSDKPLWRRSFIHKILRDLKKDGHINIEMEKNLPVYSVPERIVALLTEDGTKVVRFELDVACEFGVYAAVVSRYLLYVISESPGGVAYNLSVDEMSAVNRISPAQIYREIEHLIEAKVLKRVKSPLKDKSRALSLAKFTTAI